MLPVLFLIAAVAAAPPTSYDQRQEGEMNVRADVQNIVVLLAVPKKMINLYDMFKRSNRPEKEPELQDRADVQAMEAFVEPNTPYHVEIGSERSADLRAVEVVIAGRRRMDSDQPEQDEYKLLGATEQCGPDRVRDPVTLICKPKPQDSAEKSEEVEKEKSEEVKKDKIVPQQTPEVIAS